MGGIQDTRIWINSLFIPFEQYVDDVAETSGGIDRRYDGCLQSGDLPIP
jgi:hypothetical protein